MEAMEKLDGGWRRKGGAVGGSLITSHLLCPTEPPCPGLTHMAMSLASPGVRASSGPTSFTAEKWSWSWGQESAMWGSWYTSWRWEEMGEGAERAEKMALGRQGWGGGGQWREKRGAFVILPTINIA